MKTPARAALALLAVLAVTASVTGCGGDDDSSAGDETAAVDQVCSARDDLTTAVQAVVSDVQAGNLRTAKAGLTAVSSALGDLTQAVGELRSEERQKLQPKVDDLRSHLQQAKGASTLTELRTSLTQAGASASQVASSIRTDLTCPSS